MKTIVIRTDTILASEIAEVGLINPANRELHVLTKGGKELRYQFTTPRQAMRTRDRVIREWLKAI